MVCSHRCPLTQTLHGLSYTGPAGELDITLMVLPPPIQDGTNQLGHGPQVSRPNRESLSIQADSLPCRRAGEFIPEHSPGVSPWACVK